ncbi:NusA N-terminal domain-containing protein, partial [Mesomycoplasma ovipneumoniae]|uniref:NusA N-terminal domain-containing protein n=1 Tax=Mesomycoplasma ovipneumoniae TaxID=29562 RepID=UPI0031194A95
VKPEGERRKKAVQEVLTIPYTDVKSAVYDLKVWQKRKNRQSIRTIYNKQVSGEKVILMNIRTKLWIDTPMSKKKQSALVEALAEYQGLKNIDEDTLVKVLEESLRNVITKMFGRDSNLDIIVNLEQGELEIWRNREVVPDGTVENAMQQVALSEVHALGEDD